VPLKSRCLKIIVFILVIVVTFSAYGVSIPSSVSPVAGSAKGSWTYRFIKSGVKYSIETVVFSVVNSPIALAAVSTLGMVISPMLTVNGLNQNLERDTFNYYTKLWAEYMEPIKSAYQVQELQSVIQEGSQLARDRFQQYVKKNKLNWCPSEDCAPNYNLVFISQVPQTAFVIANDRTPVWEVTASALFPFVQKDRYQHVIKVAAELLKATIPAVRNMQSYMNDKITRYGSCDEASRTELAYRILNQNLPSNFEKLCDPQEHALEPTLEDGVVPIHLLQNLDFKKPYMEYRISTVPSFRSKEILQGSAEDKPLDGKCTKLQVDSIISPEDQNRLLSEAYQKAENYLYSYIKTKGLRWCLSQPGGQCLPSYNEIYLEYIDKMYAEVTPNGDFIWRVPAKSLCDFKINLRQEFVDYLAIEILRKAPYYSPNLSKVTSKYAEKNNLICPANFNQNEAANTLFALNLAGKDYQKMSQDLRQNKNYLNSICSGSPLVPPGFDREKAYRGETRYQSLPMQSYRELPMIIPCGPKEIQNLFLAELPTCRVLNVRQIMLAIGGLGADLDKGYSNATRTEGNMVFAIAMAGANLTTDAAHLLWPHKEMVTKILVYPTGANTISKLLYRLKPSGAKVFIEGVEKVPRFGKAVQFVATTALFAGADWLVSRELNDVFPHELVKKVLAGDVTAKEEFYVRLNAIKKEYQQQLAKDGKQNVQTLDEATFQSIINYLAQNQERGVRLLKAASDQ